MRQKAPRFNKTMPIFAPLYFILHFLCACAFCFRWAFHDYFVSYREKYEIQCVGGKRSGLQRRCYQQVVQARCKGHGGFLHSLQCDNFLCAAWHCCCQAACKPKEASGGSSEAARLKWCAASSQNCASHDRFFAGNASCHIARSSMWGGSHFCYGCCFKGHSLCLGHHCYGHL